MEKTIQAKLNNADRRYLDRSLNAPVWQVVLAVGTPLALYQGLAILFTILDTMMASHISKESVSAVAYLAQVNLILSAVGGGLAVGAGIQISLAYGQGDLLLVRKRVSSLYAISLGVGLLMLLAIAPFSVGFLRLAGTPEELIAYIVVHEMAHFLEANHSERFWAHVEDVMPDYKARRKLLREY